MHRGPVAADEWFGDQHFDEVDIEGLLRGRPEPRRSQAASLRSPGLVDLSGCGAGTAAWPDSAIPGPQSQVSEPSNLQFTGLGRGSDNAGDPRRGRGRGRGLGSVRPAKGKNFVPEEER